MKIYFLFLDIFSSKNDGMSMMSQEEFSLAVKDIDARLLEMKRCL